MSEKPNRPTPSDPQPEVGEPAAADTPQQPDGAHGEQPPPEPISVDDLLKDSGEAGEEPQTPAADLPRAASILESLLLVSAEPLPFERIRQLLGGISKAEAYEVLRTLQAKYPGETSGILVEEVAKGVQLRTNPANQEHVRKLFDAKPPRFSRAALETLSIIAYKQPATRQEIEQIRGVDCAGALKTLMERRLVKVVGKKDVPGKPFLFGTTREFMEVFSLGSLSDLPSMREIEDFLAASTATPVETPRPAFHLPAVPEGGIEQGGDELAASLGEAARGAAAVPSGELPSGFTEAELVDAASKEAGEAGDTTDGD